MVAIRTVFFLLLPVVCAGASSTTSPFIYIDSIASGATISGTTSIAGWAIDSNTSVGPAINTVQIQVDGSVVGTATYGQSRIDVCVAYPGRAGCPNVGFTYQLNAASLSSGSHTVTAIATAADGTTGSYSTTVRIASQSQSQPLPSVYIDSIAPGSTVTGTVAVSGWAIDNMTAAVGVGVGSVQIQVDGSTVGTATYGANRADVCTAFPGRTGCPNVGFTYQLNTASLSTGNHTITAIASDTNTPPASGSYSIIVKVSPQPPPSVYIDSLSSGAAVSGTVTVSGWAIDNVTTVGTTIGQVQIQVDGSTVGTATYGANRGDVCAVYPGRPGCPNVGFTYQLNTASLSAGTHIITAIATDTDSTPDSGSYAIPIKVTALPQPTISIDSPTPGSTISGTTTVSGWTLDNQSVVAAAIAGVQVQVDGVTVGSATYGIPRADACAVYPGRLGCPNVGFTYQLNAASLSAGTHTIGVLATATDGSTASSSVSVTVHSSPSITINGPSTCQEAQVCTYTTSGGTPPYNYSMVAGSVGSINAGTGAYTAPAHVVPKQTVNGCQALPNNNIFNTRIDNLPVHPNSALWMSNIDVGSNVFSAGLRIAGSTVLSTDPSVPMNFVYTPQANTNFIFQPFPDRVSQAGAAWTAPSFMPSVDNHYFTTYRDTCQQQENYQYYQTGAYTFYPAANSASGIVYSLESNQLAGVGTDAAGLPIAPLSVHQDELLAAAAGNLDAIQHAARFTLDSLSIAAGRLVWPAQAVTSGGFCQGPATVQGFVWSITGNGSTTVTTSAGNGFKPGWPAGMTIIIDNVNYTVVSVSSDGLSMVVSGAISPGTHSMSAPDSNCPPYGTRFRLKASYQFPGYLPNCDTACQNVVQAVIRQQQRYGVVLADAGTSWGFDSDGGITSYSIAIAAEQLTCNVANCLFNGLIGNASNYEIVDESSLQTSQNQGAPSSSWMEAKLGNPYVTPQDAAVIKVTDAASATTYYSVALQGVGVGISRPNEVVMAGAAPFSIQAWVTGTSNPGYTCSLSPSGGAYGTITSGCLYTPAPASQVTALTNTTVTITANADSGATRTVILQIVPLARDGNLYISLGKQSGLPFGVFPTYTDNNGIVWWNDMPQGLPINLFPEGGSVVTSVYEPTWSDYAGTNAYAVSSPQIYWTWFGGFNDNHFRIHVPNGQVTGTVLSANGGANALNMVGFSFDCNGQPVIGQTDLYSFTGSLYVGRPMTCTENVTDGVLHMVVRRQGVDYGNYSLCALACYQPSVFTFGNTAAGLVVSTR